MFVVACPLFVQESRARSRITRSTLIWEIPNSDLTEWIPRVERIVSLAALRNWARAGFTTGRAGRGGDVTGSAVARRRRSLPARLEALEERGLLSTITVNDLQ